jgi:hypothetical protein
MRRVRPETPAEKLSRMLHTRCAVHRNEDLELENVPNSRTDVVGTPFHRRGDLQTVRLRLLSRKTNSADEAGGTGMEMECR